MNYLVDTNVFSEPAKPKPVDRVVTWLRQHEREIYISVITVAEICRGIERLPDGKRKTQLRSWLQSLCDCMKGRILSFNTSTAHVWGHLKAKWDQAGLAVPSLDSLLVATAYRHGLTLVTRNTANFELTGVRLFNPFL